MDQKRAGFRAEVLRDGDGARGAWQRTFVRWAPRSIGLLILVLLGFLGVDFGAGIELLWEAKLKYVILAFAVFSVRASAGMATWVLIASSLKIGYQRKISYVRVYLAGLFAGLGTPQGAVTLTRLAMIAGDKRSVGRGLVAVGVERAAHVAVTVAFMLASSVYLSVSLETGALRWLLLGLGVVVAGVLLLVLALRVRLPGRLGRRLMSVRRLQAFVEDMKGAATEARHMPPRRVASIVAITLTESLLGLTVLFLSSRALDLDISFVVLMAASAAVGLAGLLPISINGLGPREGILTAAVAGAGLNSEGGVALGLLSFIMQAIVRVTAGVVFFTCMRKSREMTRDEVTADKL